MLALLALLGAFVGSFVEFGQKMKESTNQIIEKLKQSTDPPLPYPISEMNLSNWKGHGYELYLAHQEHVAFVRMNREDALDMVEKDDTITLPEATLQIIAAQYYELLADFSPDGLKEKLAEDPLKHSRFLNVFARLAREILTMRKHREGIDWIRGADSPLMQTPRICPILPLFCAPPTNCFARLFDLDQTIDADV